jgi:hypothetical protein
MSANEWVYQVNYSDTLYRLQYSQSSSDLEADEE